MAFFWRPDRLGGVVVAEVTNRSRHDYRVKATHLFDQGGAMTLSEGQLHANATLDVFIGQLQLEDPGEPTDPWLVIRDAYRGDKGYVMELNDAFHNARHQFGRLELYYQAISERDWIGGQAARLSVVETGKLINRVRLAAAVV